MEIIDLDETIETTTFEGILEDMKDRIIEENDTMNATEAEIDQEKEHFQGIGIEVPVKVDHNQDLKLVLTEIE